MSSRMRRIAGGIALLAGVVLVVLYATGAFRAGKKVAPGREPEPGGLPAPTRTATAVRAPVPVSEEAVGTVRSRTVVAVSAQVSARVVTVTKRAGAAVEVNEPLVTLDDRELVARKAQAAQAVEAGNAAKKRAEQSKAQADARLTQAASRHERTQRLLASKTITPEAAETAEADWLAAKASVAETDAAIAAAEAQIEQAKQVVAEAEVALGHARIQSPIRGVVSERHVEPGDLALPGRTLLVVLDPRATRLEAQVREALIARIATGQTLDVVVPAANSKAGGMVAEIVPSADPLSRTFTVRVDFGPLEGVHPGMFGRLSIPAGTREVVRVPAAAVARVGQLETVVVKTGDRWERRLVTTGALGADGSIEVLSGLSGGETVGLPSETR